MKSSKPDPSHFQSWKVAFRKNAHLLISAGYTAGHYKIESNEHYEEHITEFIVCGIKDWMRRRDRPLWCKLYSVHEEAPVSGKGSHGKSRPRTDIFIELISRWKRPEYVFEAKRLRTNGYGAGKYTGLEGMGCFTEGIYASGYDEAAMLGYVQSNTIFEWKKLVKTSITKNAVNLYLQSPQHDEVIIPEFPLEWVSEHERHDSKGRPVRIYHILLDCLPPEK
ncbi:MAG TPA: hypothetical protein VNE38_03605 [Ktedonobacteraceae bacterium]|nr:hypothetical protein [Ktedonobacteraceae bacterium]